MTPAFACLQARLQSRHGERLDAAAWRRLESVPGYDLYLKQAREGPLGHWLRAIGDDDDVGAVERRLTRGFVQHVALTASWMPSAWRPAVLWAARLPQLPQRQTALHGGFQADLQADPEADPVLERGWRAGLSLDRVWVARWLELCPRGDAASRRSLAGLAELLRGDADLFARLPDAQAAWAARRALEARLAGLFRRHARQPAALFIHLLLVALDLERLRGGLVRRALFPVAAEVGA